MVDFGCAQDYPIEAVGNQSPFKTVAVNPGTKLKETVKQKQVLTAEATEADIDSKEYVQTSRNSVLHAIEKARARAREVGTLEPLALEELTEELELPGRCFSAASPASGCGRARIWDTGASKGMTKIGDTLGVEVNGLNAPVSAGAGIVPTKKWYRESLPFGETLHVGLEDTSDTIAAGQINAEKGVETSWLAPLQVPSNKPGTCVLHAPASEVDGDSWNHVVWQGSHKVLVLKIVANMPEVRDDQTFETVLGPLCSTPACACSLRKLHEILEDPRGFPARAEKAEKRDQPGEEAEAAGAAADGHAEVADDADPYAVESRTKALNSHSGKRCNCAICLQAKQRRDVAKAGSHPHSEDKCAPTPGLHGFTDMLTYLDAIDYGAQQHFISGARSELFDLNRGTGGWLLALLTD